MMGKVQVKVIEYFTNFLVKNKDNLGGLNLKSDPADKKLVLKNSDGKYTKAVMTNINRDVIVYQLDGTLNISGSANSFKSIALFPISTPQLSQDKYSQLYGPDVRLARMFSSTSETEPVANAILFPYELKPISTIEHAKLDINFIQNLQGSSLYPTTSKAADLLYDGNKHNIIVLPPFLTTNVDDVPWYLKLEGVYATFLKALKFESLNGEVFEDWLMNKLLLSKQSNQATMIFKQSLNVYIFDSILIQNLPVDKASRNWFRVSMNGINGIIRIPEIEDIDCRETNVTAATYKTSDEYELIIDKYLGGWNNLHNILKMLPTFQQIIGYCIMPNIKVKNTYKDTCTAVHYPIYEHLDNYSDVDNLHANTAQFIAIVKDYKKLNTEHRYHNYVGRLAIRKNRTDGTLKVVTIGYIKSILMYYISVNRFISRWFKDLRSLIERYNTRATLNIDDYLLEFTTILKKELVAITPTVFYAEIIPNLSSLDNFKSIIVSDVSQLNLNEYFIKANSKNIIKVSSDVLSKAYDKFITVIETNR